MDFFQGARFTIRFLLIFVQEEEEEEDRCFTKKKFQSREFCFDFFCFVLLKKEEDYRSREEDFTDLDSTVVMGQSFQFSFLILEFQSPNRMNTKQLQHDKILWMLLLL
jgi:hypothetical protein